MKKIKEILYFIKNNKIMLIGGSVILIIFLIIQMFVFCYFKEQISVLESTDNDQQSILYEKDNEEEPKASIYVEIKGEVNNPGVYEMDSNSRVSDVIKKSGGLTKKANTRANNLSKKLIDEMVIIIYSNDEISDFSTIVQKEQQIEQKCEQVTYNVINSSCNEIENKNNDSKPNNVTTLVSINSGTKEELMNLPGIGESKANSIIEYRNSNGLFAKIEDIKNVSGISDKIYDQIKNFITT